jgi:hypothetical protein
MKYKIPKQVNILGHVYKVITVKEETLPQGSGAECSFPDRIIRISDSLKGELKWLIFLHEVRHGYHFENGSTQIMHAQVQEMDCEQFASLISSLQKQNIL